MHGIEEEKYFTWFYQALLPSSGVSLGSMTRTVHRTGKCRTYHTPPSAPNRYLFLVCLKSVSWEQSSLLSLWTVKGPRKKKEIYIYKKVCIYNQSKLNLYSHRFYNPTTGFKPCRNLSSESEQVSNLLMAISSGQTDQQSGGKFQCHCISSSSSRLFLS